MAIRLLARKKALFALGYVKEDADVPQFAQELYVIIYLLLYPRAN